MNRRDILKEQIEVLPLGPGVYLFKNRSKEILYIGKAASLRDRVRSYYSNSLKMSRGPWIAKMLEDVDSIDIKETDSALEALILEAKLIKKYQPKFNSKEKDDKSFNYVMITKERFPQVKLVRERDIKNSAEDLSVGEIFGPFPQGSLLKEALNIVRKIFPYRDHKCKPFDEKAPESPRPCFNRQIGLCPGTCVGAISYSEYGRRIRNIKLFFQGRKNEVFKRLERDRDRHARAQEFERAGEVQRQIASLSHIRDISLLSSSDFGADNPSRSINEGDAKGGGEDTFRIEGYDIAHTSGSFVVGAMSVVEGGVLRKDMYRKFRVKGGDVINDVKALKEILSRRVGHKEWPMPDVVVVDGAIAQKNAAEDSLSMVGLDIPVIAVSKDRNHRPHRYYGDIGLIAKYKKDIISVNMEAHRSALSYHRLLRERLKG